MSALTFDRTALLLWAAPRLDVEPSGLIGCMAIGLERDGEIIAACLYRHHSGPNIEILFATSDRRWATRGNIRAFLHYPFVQLGCVRVTCVTRQSNRKARQLLEGLGFKTEGMLRGFYGGESGIVYGLLRFEAEKWLRAKHGQVEQSPVPA